MTNTAHHRHFSVVVLYLKVHTAYFIPVYIEHNGNSNFFFLTMIHTFDIKQGKPIERHGTLTAIFFFSKNLVLTCQVTLHFFF